MDVIVVSQIGAKHTGHEVQVRGFLYRANDGRWILSDQPGLKSCCVGSASKIQSQVVVDGPLEFEGSARPVVLKGTLSVHPQGTHLSHPILVEESANWGMSWVLLFAFGIGVFYFFWRKKRWWK